MNVKLKIGLLTKIFVILILSTFFIQVLLIFPLAGPGNQQSLPELITWHLTQYMTLLIEKIEDPQDSGRITEVSEKFDSDIRVENIDGSVITGELLPSYAEVTKKKTSAIVGIFSNIPIGNFGGRLYYAQQTPKYNYIFSPRGLRIPTLVNRATRFIIMFMFLPVVISFFLIRFILKPIQTLKIAVDRFGAGDLRARANIDQSDELGALAVNFNNMADEINNILVARQQLISDVSHELRSPISRLKMALESMAGSPLKKDLADDIDELQSLTDTILDAERIRSGASTPTLEECNIISLIHDVKAQLKGGRKISLDSLPNSINVLTDRRWTKIVLRNVIENAVKYSRPDSKPIEITSQESPDFCEIFVKDFGDGIAEENLEKVFEPFYRVDSSRTKASGGFGIGLHLCRRMMTAQGGHIRIASSKGEWTKVTLRFLI